MGIHIRNERGARKGSADVRGWRTRWGFPHAAALLTLQHRRSPRHPPSLVPPWRRAGTCSGAALGRCLRLDSAKSLLTIIFTNRAWFDDFSSCSCSSLASKSCPASQSPSDRCPVSWMLKSKRRHTLPCASGRTPIALDRNLR